jgi:hypothetical protein
MSMFFASHVRPTKAAVAAVVLGLGAVVASAPVEARMGFGGFHGGMGGFHGGMGSFHGPMGGFGGRGVMHSGFGGFRQPFMHPGFHQGFGQRRFFAHRGFFHRHNRFGGPFAVGLLSGAALGAFTYDAPYYGGYYSDAGYGEDCYVIRRRVVNPWGYVTVRRALVCG